MISETSKLKLHSLKNKCFSADTKVQNVTRHFDYELVTYGTNGLCTTRMSLIIYNQGVAFLQLGINMRQKPDIEILLKQKPDTQNYKWNITQPLSSLAANVGVEQYQTEKKIEYHNQKWANKLLLIYELNQGEGCPEKFKILLCVRLSYTLFWLGWKSVQITHHLAYDPLKVLTFSLLRHSESPTATEHMLKS